PGFPSRNAPSCTGTSGPGTSPTPRTATCARCSTGNWRLAVIRSPTWGGWSPAGSSPETDPPPVTATPSALTGFPSREELIARYTELSGRDVSELPYYVAFQRWRAACI